MLHDTVPEPSLIIFKYFTGSLLTLVQQDLPISLTKRVLKDALQGLAALHDRNIVHNCCSGLFIIDWKLTPFRYQGE